MGNIEKKLKKYRNMSDGKLYSELSLLEKRKGLVEVSLNALSGKIRESQEKEYQNFANQIDMIKQILKEREESKDKDHLADMVEEDNERASYLKRTVPVKSTLTPEENAKDISPAEQVEKIIAENKTEKAEKEADALQMDDIDIEFIQQIFADADNAYRPQEAPVSQEVILLSTDKPQKIEKNRQQDEDELVGDVADDNYKNIIKMDSESDTKPDTSETDTKVENSKQSVIQAAVSAEITMEKAEEQVIEDIYAERDTFSHIFDEAGNETDLKVDPDNMLTDVLAQTKEDIVKNPVIEYTDTQILKMKPRDRQREKEIMENMRRVIIERINMNDNTNSQNDLLDKLTIINHNVSRLA